MLADDGAAAHGVDADLVCFPAVLDLVPAVGVDEGIVADGIDLVRESERGAAGGVQLAVVVGLHDLDVIVLAEELRRLFCEVPEQIHPEGHVARAEDGHLVCGIFHPFFLLRGVARGGKDEAALLLGGVGEDVVERRGRGEVDDDVRVEGGRRKALVDGVGQVVRAAHVNAEDGLELRRTDEGLIDGASDAARRAGDRDLYHIFKQKRASAFPASPRFPPSSR